MPALLNAISFPRLGLSFDLDRVAFSIGSLDIHWYGIIIAFGFLLAVWYCFKHTDLYGISKDDFTNLLMFAVPIAIIGARAYYVTFMYNEYYYGNPQLIFRIWDGGLAIYGAVIAGVLTCVVYCRVKHIRIGTMLDLCVPGLLIGQGIGRWGNFVNVEAYGTRCSPYLFAMKVEELKAYVHPCFFYESVWCGLGLLILHFYQRRRRYCGEVFLLYTAWYGLGRGFIEGFRSDSLYLFDTGLRISQFVGFVSCALALATIVYLYLFREKDAEKLENPYYTPKKRKAAEVEDAEAYEDGDYEEEYSDEYADEYETDADEYEDEDAPADEPADESPAAAPDDEEAESDEDFYGNDDK